MIEMVDELGEMMQEDLRKLQDEGELCLGCCRHRAGSAPSSRPFWRGAPT